VWALNYADRLSEPGDLPPPVTCKHGRRSILVRILDGVLVWFRSNSRAFNEGCLAPREAWFPTTSPAAPAVATQVWHQAVPVVHGIMEA
jgi:hypothetical protein